MGVSADCSASGAQISTPLGRRTALPPPGGAPKLPAQRTGNVHARAPASSRWAEPPLAAPALMRARARADLSVALCAAGRAVPARRRGRCRGPHHRRPPERDVGPADGGREQGRRGRQYRGAGGAQRPKPTATRSTSARSATRSTSSSIRRSATIRSTDFAPVTLMCVYPNIMAVPNSSPDRSVPEFIARAKADPGKMTYCSSGIGTSLHLAGELFKRMAGVNLTHIPYRGAGPALNDLIPGRVDAIFANFPSTLPLCAAGAVARARGHDREAPARGAGPAGDRRVRAGLRRVVLVRAVRRREDAARDRREAPYAMRSRRSTSAGEAALRAARRDRRRLDAGRACAHFSRPRWTAGVRSSRRRASRTDSA